MTVERVRFGLIGFGAWGQCHADAVAGSPLAELVAISVRSEASQQAAREKHPQAKVYGDSQEMLDQENLDVVIVVVPSNVHYRIASQVLESGAHLLLEKPMSLSVADCQSLIDLAARKERLLAIGHEFRLSSLWGRIKEVIDEGVLGHPQYALVELSRNPYRQGADGWRYDIDRVGNWILEEPIHFFDLARWYLSGSGDPVSVYAAANSRQEGHPDLQDNFSAIMHFCDGGYAVVSQTLSAFEHHQTVKIAGTQGALWASWSGALDRTRHATSTLRVFDGNKVIDEEIIKPAGEVYELEAHVELLSNAIQKGTSLAATGEDGLWSVAMCLAAQESVEKQQPVFLSNMPHCLKS